ncbi:MAG: ricin-type beta-trefoil lectin domain protein [Oligoflexia bacterium]|nr:ricin-type beta-trefoil lectin domain protein [Oligoflexia bacterium]MBF0364529.1 ricin-type beta-trefoil lectin domain protein [Oligoflexia bacterium]
MKINLLVISMFTANLYFSGLCFAKDILVTVDAEYNSASKEIVFSITNKDARSAHCSSVAITAFFLSNEGKTSIVKSFLEKSIVIPVGQTATRTTGKDTISQIYANGGEFQDFDYATLKWTCSELRVVIKDTRNNQCLIHGNSPTSFVEMINCNWGNLENQGLWTIERDGSIRDARFRQCLIHGQYPNSRVGMFDCDWGNLQGQGLWKVGDYNGTTIISLSNGQCLIHGNSARPNASLEIIDCNWGNLENQGIWKIELY